MHSLDVADCTYGRRVEEIAEVCGVDLSTARRWKAGKARVPATAAALLLGDLGAFSASWQGWRIQGEEIISPDGWRIRRDDALSVPLMHGQIAALRAELRDKTEVSTLDEQPEPGDWPAELLA